MRIKHMTGLDMHAFLRQILNPTLKVSVLSASVKLYRRATRSDSQILAGFS